MSVLTGIQSLTISGSTFNVVHGGQSIMTTTSPAGKLDFAKQQAAIAAATGGLIPNVPISSGKNALPRLTTMFTGRRGILQQIFQYFKSSGTSMALKKQLIFVLYGLGGSGKTQIMAKFVVEFAEQFSGIYYVDASTQETIQSGFENIARNASAGKSVDDALAWLSQEQREWLLLIDNADDPEINLRRYFPPSRHGNIIVTTRNKSSRLHAPDSNCNVSGMAPDEAIELLLKCAMVEHSSRNRSLCASIANELGYLALAIAQAGAYIAQSCPLDDYLRLYREDRAKLLKIHSVQTTDDYEWTVYTTWEMSLTKLSSTSAMLLRICAFMHYDGIPRAMFQNAATSGEHSDSFRDATRFLKYFKSENGDWSNFKFLDHINELVSYSLIDVDSENHMYSIHPLVHVWSRDGTSPAENDEARGCALQILALSITDEYSAEGFAFRRSLLPHIDEARPQDLEPDVAMKLRDAYAEGDRWKAVEELQQSILETKRRQLGDEHPDTLSSMAYLASAYWNQERWKKAEELCLQVLEARKKLLGDEHSDTLLSMGSLAYIYWGQGRWKETEELEVQVVEMRRRLQGDEHAQTLAAMNTLAYTYIHQDRWKEAGELELKVTEASRRLLGDDHKESLSSMSGLAYTYTQQGRWKDAEELQLKVTETRRRILGDEHRETLASASSLSDIYLGQEKWKEAEEQVLWVLETRKRVLGEEHLDTLSSMAKLSFTYWSQRRWKESEEMDLRVIEGRKIVLGDKHPDMLSSMASLAHTYWNQGRWKDSEEMGLRVIEGRKRVLGDEHPDTLLSMANLAHTYWNQGRWKDSEEMSLRVIEGRKSVLGEEHPDTLSSMAHLARTYWDQDRLKETEQLEVQVMNARRKVLGDENLDTVASIHTLAVTYSHQSRWKEAEKLALEATEARRRLLGAEHLDTLASMYSLAYIYWGQGRWKENEELEFQVVEARKKLLGDDHPDTLESITALAITYRKRGKRKEAKKLELQVVKARKNQPDEQNQSQHTRTTSRIGCVHQ